MLNRIFICVQSVLQTWATCKIEISRNSDGCDVQHNSRQTCNDVLFLGRKFRKYCNAKLSVVWRIHRRHKSSTLNSKDINYDDMNFPSISLVLMDETRISDIIFKYLPWLLMVKLWILCSCQSTKDQESYQSSW